MKAILFTTVLFSGLVAGLFYAYSCSVNPGLKALSDTEYIRAMQSINVSIQNPVFFLAFMGLLVVFPVSAYQCFGNSATYYLLIASMLIYFVFVFGITAAANVPLNEQLAAFPTAQATPSEITAMRKAFEKPWNFFHSIRTVASVISFGLLVVFLLRQNFKA